MTDSDDRNVHIEDLGRFVFSVIASYLTEFEGTSFFLCKKGWSKQFLPIFRLPDRLQLSINRDQTSSRRKHRHKFMVIPVQDASVRLERLNTRRFKKLGLRCSGLCTEELAQTSVCRQPSLLRFYSEDDDMFLPGTTLLVSYPRSGNTLLRSLLEATTGFVTGSDTRPDRALSLALADRHDLVGEGITSPNQTRLVKTHWPERIGFRKYTAHRAVFLVRNPFDAIDSYWNLNVTNTHTEKVTDEVYAEHEKFFYDLVLNEMKVWVQFLDYWSSQSTEVLWMRYEDLVLRPKEQLMRVLHFCMTQPAEVWEERVESVLMWREHGYQPLSLDRREQSEAKSPFGRSLDRYPPDLQQRLHEIDTKGWLETFGYHVFKQSFPKNIHQGGLPPLQGATIMKVHPHQSTSSSKGIQVNFPPTDELRPPLSPYGRNMRDWRRKHTNDDLNPFPTKSHRR